MKNLKSRTEKNKADFWFTPEADAKMLNNSAEYEIAKSYAAGLTRGRKEAKHNYELGIKQIIKNLFKNGMQPDDIIKLAKVDKNTVDMALRGL